MKYLFLTLVFCFIQLATFSQSVQGIVMDKNDNSPLIGVNVITNSSGTITDFDGKFELKLLEGENILIFS